MGHGALQMRHSGDVSESFTLEYSGSMLMWIIDFLTLVLGMRPCRVVVARISLTSKNRMNLYRLAGNTRREYQFTLDRTESELPTLDGIIHRY
jgi:hypothetical protein